MTWTVIVVLAMFGDRSVIRRIIKGQLGASVMAPHRHIDAGAGGGTLRTLAHVTAEHSSSCFGLSLHRENNVKGIFLSDLFHARRFDPVITS